MQVAVLQYNAGNVQSVLHALNRLGIEGMLTDSSEILQNADKVSSSTKLNVYLHFGSA
jgi:glutamine amidotransferase